MLVLRRALNEVVTIEYGGQHALVKVVDIGYRGGVVTLAVRAPAGATVRPVGLRNRRDPDGRITCWEGEQVEIGFGGMRAVVTVVRVGYVSRSVRLGFDAPDGAKIWRPEAAANAARAPVMPSVE